MAVSHSAAVYTVRVRGKGRGKTNDYRALGDIDAEGTWLGDVLWAYLPEIDFTNDAETRTLRFDSGELAEGRRVGPDEVHAILRHGQTGVSADLSDEDGEFLIHQRPEHSHEVRCGAVFRLPRSATTGWLCLHVNNGRGIFSLLRRSILERFQSDYPDLVLEFVPCQVENAAHRRRATKCHRQGETRHP